ncbi:hypothetical protein QQS21_011367 [Conoideocrella luteorostrata]|uniref:2,5-diamino-6-ribosylamino-4(3H)-pyrimidinone 5'-phosphate reductase n=1 Tax=Conoideocrella luteorostrata TaxID=1105319 RepID=A0AAJ0CD91_9HYPO|nr:hypothetical protein QQS21_011367 [Conoideocrella luteorostrata]
MRRIRYNAATSLDGFIASPDGSTEWIVQDTTIDFDALYAQFGVYLMGRKTYEVVTSHGGMNPLASKSKDSVIVISRHMKQEDYPNITIWRDGFIEKTRAIKAQDGKDIWFMGGGQLAPPLLEAGLIDALEMAVMPVVIGKGIKMIAESDAAKQSYALDLMELEKLDGSGIVILRYALRYES